MLRITRYRHEAPVFASRMSGKWTKHQPSPPEIYSSLYDYPSNSCQDFPVPAGSLDQPWGGHPSSRQVLRNGLVFMEPGAYHYNTNDGGMWWSSKFYSPVLCKTKHQLCIIIHTLESLEYDISRMRCWNINPACELTPYGSHISPSDPTERDGRGIAVHDSPECWEIVVGKMIHFMFVVEAMKKNKKLVKSTKQYQFDMNWGETKMMSHSLGQCLG